MEQQLVVSRVGDIQENHKKTASKQNKIFFTKYITMLKVHVAGQNRNNP